eukprot:scaffold90929_cov30-Tisochrysis_lutea.AAC.4
MAMAKMYDLLARSSQAEGGGQQAGAESWKLEVKLLLNGEWPVELGECVRPLVSSVLGLADAGRKSREKDEEARRRREVAWNLPQKVGRDLHISASHSTKLL